MLIDFTQLEWHLNSPSGAKEIELYVKKDTIKELDRVQYLVSKEFNSDFKLLKYVIFKNGGLVNNLRINVGNVSYLKQFYKIFDCLEKSMRRNKKIRYYSEDESTYLYFVYDNYRFEKLIRPDRDDNYFRSITKLV